MKKKRSLAYLSLLAICLLGLLGCGKDDNLNPTSDLVLRGAEPAAAQVDVNPPQSRVVYFYFEVILSDTSLSVIEQDAWTVNKYEATYSLESDPGGHLLNLPEDHDGKQGNMISPTSGGRIGINLVSRDYVTDNASGFTGTSDVATVNARVKFWARRHTDNSRKILIKNYIFTIGDY